MKRIIILLTLLAVTTYGADTKLEDMTLLSSADCSDDELLYVVDDPNGTPVDRKIARFEFLLGWAGSTNITTLGTVVTGMINHEAGGLEADVSGFAGMLAVSGGSTSQVDEKSEVEAQLTDVTDLAEADGDTWTGTHDLSGATVTMPKRTSNDNRHYRFNIVNPNAFYDIDTQLCIEPNLPANITITEVTITLDADPGTELDWDLKYADAFIGLANATLIVAIDTTNGTTDVDAGWNDNTVVATKALYVEFAADPDSNITQAMVKIRYDYD